MMCWRCRTWLWVETVCWQLSLWRGGMEHLGMSSGFKIVTLETSWQSSLRPTSWHQFRFLALNSLYVSITFYIGSCLLAWWPAVHEGSAKVSGCKCWQTSRIHRWGLLGFSLKMVFILVFWYSRGFDGIFLSCAGVHILGKQPTSPDPHSSPPLLCFVWRLPVSPWSPQKWRHPCMMRPHFKIPSGFATFGQRVSSFGVASPGLPWHWAKHWLLSNWENPTYQMKN